MDRKLVVLISILLVSSSIHLFAQIDNYKWSARFGWGIPNFQNFGQTGDWVKSGKGMELMLLSVGYNNLNVSLTYNYFNGLIGNKAINYKGNAYPASGSYRKVFMNLAVSYEYELFRRIYLEPEIGWVRAHITAKGTNPFGKGIAFEPADGVMLGGKAIKYLKVLDSAYLGIYINLNYCVLSYNSISTDLGGNTLRYGFGFLLKGTD